MPTRERLQAFIDMVVANRHVEAIEAFYHPDASMQENQQPPRVGRDTLVEGERRMLARNAVQTDPAQVVLLDGDRTVVLWRFRFTPPEGPDMVLEELALQRWDGDRIAEERFFYDPAQMRPTGGSKA